MKLLTVLKVEVLAKRLAVAVGRFVSFVYFESISRATDLINSFFVGKKLSSATAIPVGAPYFAADYVEGAPGSQQYTVPDEVKVLFSKVLEDDYIGTDVYPLYFAEDYADNEQAYSQTDGVTKTVGKVFGDTSRAADLINSFSVGKALEDISRAIDLINSFFVGKSLSLTAVAPVNQPYFAADYVEGAPGDQQYTAPDEVKVLFSKVLEDDYLGTDVYPLYFAEDYADNEQAYSQTDGVTKKVSKPFSELITSSDDQPITVFSKVENDIGIATELFDRYFAEEYVVGGVIQQTYTRAQVAIKRLGKFISETFATADSGLLRSQDYLDYSYFELDYIGVSRTF